MCFYGPSKKFTERRIMNFTHRNKELGTVFSDICLVDDVDDGSDAYDEDGDGVNVCFME